MRRALVLVNPSSRSGRDCNAFLLRRLPELGVRPVNPDRMIPPDEASDAILAARDTIDLVVVGGGDGSVNSALAGLAATKIPFLLIPLGTANNLARTLNVPSDPEQALALLEAGTVRAIDMGLANGKPFVNVAGVGLSARVNKAVPAADKRRYGAFAFARWAVRLARQARHFKAFIVHDRGVHRARTLQITVCNGRHYGSGLTISRDASLDDGVLHCLSTEVDKWWHFFFIAKSFFVGHYDPHARIKLVSSSRLRVMTGRPMDVDLDGDIKTRTPVTFSVEKAAVNVFVPGTV